MNLLNLIKNMDFYSKKYLFLTLYAELKILINRSAKFSTPG